MKVCRRCGKPAEEFYRNSRSADGLDAWCKTCRQTYQAEWQKKNPALVREEKRRYRASHQEEVREYKRRYYETKGERMKEQAKLWRRLNPDKVATQQAMYAVRRRWGQLLRDHGLTPEAFVELWESQEGKCAICRYDIPGTRIARNDLKDGQGVTHVDHDHASGAIRGLLCHRCNQGLGLFRDSVEALRAAQTYLETAPDRSIPRTSVTPAKPWAYTLRRIIRPQPALKPRGQTTHCPHGHPYDETNTYVTPQGHRKCRTCIRERQQARRESAS